MDETLPEVPRKLVFLANARARLGVQGAEGARSALLEEGFDVKAFDVADSRRRFLSILHEHLRREEPLIAIGGGDGTQRAAAEVIAGTSSVMAVVPLGTGNEWAGDLGIPQGAGAAAALASARVRAIDLGVANGQGFVNVATLGLSALIVKNMSKRAKGALGRLAYLSAVLRSLRQLRPFDVTIETDGETYKGAALQVVAAAGRTHAGHRKVTRAAENDDGLLSVYVLHDTDRGGLLKYGVALLSGRHTALDEVWSCETSHARITTRPAKPIIVDGEPSGTTPLGLSIRVRSLKVLVPMQGPGAQAQLERAGVPAPAESAV